MFKSELIVLPAASGISPRFVRISVLAIVVLPTVFDFFFFQTRVARISRIFVCLAILAALLMNHSKIMNLKVANFHYQLLIIALYLIGTFSALAQNGVATPNFVLLVLMLFIASTSLTSYRVTLESLGQSVNVLVLLSTVVILFSLNPRQYYASDFGYPVFFDSIGIPGRNYGIFSHANVLGSATAISFIYILSSKKNKLWLLFPIFCWSKTGSRTALVIIAVGLICFVISKIYSKKDAGVRRFLETPSVVITFISMILVASSVQFISIIILLDPERFTGRVAIWQTSVELVKNNSLFGLGWGWEDRAISSNLLNVWAVSAHNQILEVAFSAGYVGLIIFLLLLSAGVTNFATFSLLEKSLFLALVVSGFSESYLDLPYPSIQTFIFFLLIIGSHWTKRNQI